jgi:hypothetical protein
MARLVRHRQTKGPATDRPNLNHRATSRLYQPNCKCPDGLKLEVMKPGNSGMV